MIQSPYEHLSIGEKAPDVVTAVIEIPKGSHNKYEYDEKRMVFALDRVFYSPVHFPADYGFIPETRSEDGDHLDVLVVGSDPTFPGCVVDAKVVGLLKMIDSGEEDFKVLAVQKSNPRFSHIADLNDMEAVMPHFLKEVAHFFQVYKDLQGKKVEILGWHDAATAKAEIQRAQEMYKKEGT